MDKFNDFILCLRKKTNYFVYSGFMTLIIALTVLLFWIANLQFYGLLAVVIFTCFVLIVYDDLLPIVGLMFIIPMSFRDTGIAFGEQIVPYAIVFALLVLSLIFHFIKYPMKKVKLDRFFFVILSINCIFLIGGLFSGNGKHYFDAIDIFLISGIMPLVIHFFFYNNVKINNNIDVRKYLCICFLIAISLSSAEICFAKLHVHLHGKLNFISASATFCWANSNNFATLALIAIPLCCYMILSSKYIWAWFIELLFLYLTVYFSGSDGALATLGVFSPFLMLVVYKNAYKRNLPIIRLIFFAVVSIVVLGFSYLYLFDRAVLLDFISTSANDTGRSTPYKMAVETFLKFPILGIGLGGGDALLNSISQSAIYNGFYHSTFFHILACTGAVGIIGYVFYYLERMKYMINKDSVLGKFALYSFIMFGLYSLIDTNEFNIVLMFMTTLITIVGLINKKGSDDKPLPLWIKNPIFCSLNQSCK